MVYFEKVFCTAVLIRVFSGSKPGDINYPFSCNILFAGTDVTYLMNIPRLYYKEASDSFVCYIYLI